MNIYEVAALAEKRAYEQAADGFWDHVSDPKETSGDRLYYLLAHEAPDIPGSVPADMTLVYLAMWRHYLTQFQSPEGSNSK